MTIGKSFLTILVAVALFLGGCANNSANPPNPINTGATITLNLAKGIRLVDDGIRSANAAGFASNELTATVLRLTVRINKAGIDADAVLRSQANNPNASVKTLLEPLVAAIQQAVDQDVIKITNLDTRNQVKSALLALQLTIKSTLAALAPNASRCYATRTVCADSKYPGFMWGYSNALSWEVN